MTHLPIAADTAEHFYCRMLPEELNQLTPSELIHVKSLLPSWAKWVVDTKVAAKLSPDIALTDLNTVFPYMVAWYETPNGWLCTTRRHVEGRPAEYGQAAIPQRLLNAGCCWEAQTPAAALLAMMTERINTKEMRYGDFGQMVVLRKAFVTA